jgi:glutathione-regulated potassium-efflux system ancillary protein KefC
VIWYIAKPMGMPLMERPVFTVLLAQGGEFAFVVFQAAAGARVFSAETASLLIGAVAVSMMVSPLLLVAVDRCCCPPAGPRRTLPESASSRRAGDHRGLRPLRPDRRPPARGGGLRRHGAGPRRRHDGGGAQLRLQGVLRRRDAPGPAAHRRRETAKVLVVAVDDKEQSLRIVDLARENFPQLELVARARDVTHWNALRDRG